MSAGPLIVLHDMRLSLECKDDSQPGASLNLNLGRKQNGRIGN